MNKFVSFGAGVQSTTILALISSGKLEQPDALIFADTGWEPKAVYEHLEWCKAKCSELGLLVYVVSAGDIRSDAFSGNRWASMPLYTLEFVESSVENDHDTGELYSVPQHYEKGAIRRQCTKEYKIDPITKKMRELMNATGKRLPAGSAELWMGISLDEVYRMKSSLEAWKVHRFPLIDLGLRRSDCLNLLREMGWPEPPRSACIGCPFHSDKEWLRIKANAEEWADACEFDRKIRKRRNVRGDLYLHRSCVPLEEVKLSSNEGQASLWNNECEGMCGV